MHRKKESVAMVIRNFYYERLKSVNLAIAAPPVFPHQETPSDATSCGGPAGPLLPQKRPRESLPKGRSSNATDAINREHEGDAQQNAHEECLKGSEFTAQLLAPYYCADHLSSSAKDCAHPLFTLPFEEQCVRLLRAARQLDPDVAVGDKFAARRQRQPTDEERPLASISAFPSQGR
jgi:hypothetical protein